MSQVASEFFWDDVDDAARQRLRLQLQQARGIKPVWQGGPPQFITEAPAYVYGDATCNVWSLRCPRCGAAPLTQVCNAVNKRAEPAVLLRAVCRAGCGAASALYIVRNADGAMAVGWADDPYMLNGATQHACLPGTAPGGPLAPL